MNCTTLRTTLLITLVVLGLSSAQAADHRESPAVLNDPAADINDIYAFMNPNNAEEMVLVMTVFPNAPADALFSDAMRYRFLMSNNAQVPDQFSIDCTFNAPATGATQTFDCSGPAGITVSGNVGETVDFDPDMRIFTGLRDDPFFFDGPGTTATVQSGSPMFTGEDSFKGENILTIVVGIKRSLLNRNNQFPVLRIWSATQRI